VPGPLLDAYGKPLRRPVVYLDTSTLGNAYPGAQDADPMLTEVVALAASRGTLCLSIAHVIELAAIPVRDYALGIGRWLDSLDRAWVQVTSAEDAELTHALRAQVGLTADPARLPVHHTITAALRDNFDTLTPPGTVEILRDPTVAGFISSTHGKIEWQQAREFSVRAFKMLHFDRAGLPSETSREQVRSTTTAKFVNSLRRKARAILSSEPTVIGSSPRGDADADAAIDRLLGDPLSLPINRIAPHCWRAVGDRILDQSSESKKFVDRYGSFMWDTRHAVSGAFADVFTCDRFVNEILGDFRTDRGLQRQLSVGRDVDRVAFAAALRQQIEAVDEGARS